MTTNNSPKHWHTYSVEHVLDDLKVSAAQGLSQTEVETRLERYGPNELIEQGVKSPWRILADQFKETMVLVLIAAAIMTIYSMFAYLKAAWPSMKEGSEG